MCVYEYDVCVYGVCTKARAWRSGLHLEVVLSFHSESWGLNSVHPTDMASTFTHLLALGIIFNTMY